MWINKKTGTMHGKLGDKVYYVRYGKQYVRILAPSHMIKNSARFQEVKMWFAEAVTLWRDLPADIKWQWERYASGQGRASDIESNWPVCTRHCPIPSYPPRPKLMIGVAAFTGSYILAKKYGLEGLRLLAPTGIPVPPAPLIECDYDHASGKLIVGIDTPELVSSVKYHDRKLLLWITAIHRSKKLVHTRLLDVVDFPAKPTRLERQFAGIAETHKAFGYNPLVFKDMDYVLIYLAAQALIATSPLRAPVISSSSNIISYYILNEPRLVGIEDLIKSGGIINPARIRWGGDFLARIAELRAQSDKIATRRGG